MGVSPRGHEELRRSASHAVIEAVAEREGIDITELEPPQFEPLYTVVDPDALDRIFDRADDETASINGVVQFTYAGYDVSVHSDGRVEVSD